LENLVINKNQGDMSMSKRTLKVQGWGTGTAYLTASLDGEQIFSGNVDLTEQTDENSSSQDAPTLFVFEIPIEFAGTKQMKIIVDKARVHFGMIVANYTEVDWGQVYYTGPYEFDDVSPARELGIRDPRDNVKINGIPQTIERSGLLGTWCWTIDPGSTFEHDLLVAKGNEQEF